MSGFVVETEILSCGIYVRVDDGSQVTSIVVNHDGRLHVWTPTSDSNKPNHGKVFSDAESALANYKKQSIKDAIVVALDVAHMRMFNNTSKELH